MFLSSPLLSGSWGREPELRCGQVQKQAQASRIVGRVLCCVLPGGRCGELLGGSHKGPKPSQGAAQLGEPPRSGPSLRRSPPPRAKWQAGGGPRPPLPQGGEGGFPDGGGGLGTTTLLASGASTVHPASPSSPEGARVAGWGLPAGTPWGGVGVTGPRLTSQGAEKSPRAGRPLREPSGKLAANKWASVCHPSATPE